MDEETLALEVRKCVRKNDEQLYQILRKMYSTWLIMNSGTFLDFLVSVATTPGDLYLKKHLGE